MHQAALASADLRPPALSSAGTRCQRFPSYSYRAWSIRCSGLLIVRSQASRDVAALLDFDPGVASFACRASLSPDGSNRYEVLGVDGVIWTLDDEDECFLDLWGRIRRANCRWLLAGPPRRVGRQMLVEAATALRQEEGCTVGTVVNGLSGVGGVSAFAFLVAAGIASVDLDSELLSLQTPVHAGRAPFNMPASRGKE